MRIEVLSLSLYEHRDDLSSPFVYEVCKLAKMGWDWKRFGKVPFSLPPISEIWKREVIRDREKKRRKRELSAVISTVLSPPKFSYHLGFKVNRTGDGVFYTTTNFYLFSSILPFLLERFAHILLSHLLAGRKIVKWEIPEEIIPLKGEPFAEGFVLLFFLPPFAMVIIPIPKGFSEGEQLSMMNEEGREISEVKVGKGKVLVFDGQLGGKFGLSINLRKAEGIGQVFWEKVEEDDR